MNKSKINWGNRFKNKTVLLSLVAAVALFANQITQAFGLDYSAQVEQAVNIAGSVITLFVGLGIVVDPNTKGVADSELAQTYTKPRDDKNPEEYAGFLNQEKDKDENVVDGTKELIEYEPHEDSNEIDPYHMEDTEEFFKDESKPYGIDWEEEPVDVNVNSENKNDKKVDVKDED